MSVLVVNAGGVTLELTVVDHHDHVVDRVHVDPWDGRDTQPIADVATRRDITAVGHRIVHGGTHILPTPIDDTVVSDLERLVDLIPIHQERALHALSAARKLLPALPHVACFDTTFHLTIPDCAAIYPVPAEWRQRWPLRRVGFHGLSHQHVAHATPTITAGRAPLRIISCHLGSGASVCAIRGGRSVDTTMGMTPLEGLTMVSRAGSVDPGMLIWLLRDQRLTLDEVDEGLNQHSGLAGLTGGTGDMRDVLQRRSSGDPVASLAFDIYIHRLKQGIAAMAASLGGLDALAFTGGVGQHVPELRRAAVDGLAHLGPVLDGDRNAAATADADVSTESARVRCIVVATGEHRTIAAQTRDTAHTKVNDFGTRCGER